MMKIVAEAGTAHGGSVEKAREIIARAAEAGADCVKFQVVLAREIIHPETGLVPLPGGDTPLYDVFRSLERDRDFYENLRLACRTEGVEFLATPFGLESCRLLREMHVGSLKIASPELNHIPLLKEAASWHGEGGILILSSGVSKEEDVDRAMELFPHRERTILLHCITAYPAPPEEYNLNILSRYSDRYACSVGVSDHSMEPLPVPLTSLCRGASLLEKHFCLNHTDGGLDDPIALEPADFALMVREIRLLEKIEPESRQEALYGRFGQDYINSILGTGEKLLAPSEKDNYGRTNRSVHALHTLKAGMVLTEENTALLRTEKILHPGLEPRFYRDILGKKLKRKIESGQGINWDDIDL